MFCRRSINSGIGAPPAGTLSRQPAHEARDGSRMKVPLPTCTRSRRPGRKKGMELMKIVEGDPAELRMGFDPSSMSTSRGSRGLPRSSRETRERGRTWRRSRSLDCSTAGPTWSRTIMRGTSFTRWQSIWPDPHLRKHGRVFLYRLRGPDDPGGRALWTPRRASSR